MAKTTKHSTTKRTSSKGTASKGSSKEVATRQGEQSLMERGLSPFEEMDRMFENFFGRNWPRAWMRPFQMEWPHWGELPAPFHGRWPRVDVVDQENNIVVRAEVPGVNKEDLDVSMTDNTVTLRGCTRHEEKEEKENYFRSEMSSGEFTRTVALPSDVDTSKAQAKLTDGVLELTLPKVEKAKRKQVKID